MRASHADDDQQPSNRQARESHEERDDRFAEPHEHAANVRRADLAGHCEALEHGRYAAAEAAEAREDAGERERRIETAIASLPARHREVLLLVGVEGFGPAEAAAVCGVSPEALRQRVSRARAVLAKKLAGSAQSVASSLSEAST